MTGFPPGSAAGAAAGAAAPGAARVWSQREVHAALNDRYLLVRHMERTGFRRILLACGGFLGECGGGGLRGDGECGRRGTRSGAHATAP